MSSSVLKKFVHVRDVVLGDQLARTHIERRGNETKSEDDVCGSVEVEVLRDKRVARSLCCP